MATSLYFTPNLARHTQCPTAELAAATVAELFQRYFETWPAVRGFVLDDQGEVRHHVKLDIDADGVTLAFGSTTGNLWLNEDQGDRWQNLSHTLPPIYCVRFVN